MSQHDCLLIIDFGSQTTQLIARRLRSIGVYSVLVSPRANRSDVPDRSIRGVILSGGPACASAEDAWPIPSWIYDLSCPILGICYGMQRLAVECGGEVCPHQTSEFGMGYVNPLPGWLENIWGEAAHEVWMSHGDQVSKLPPGFIRAGSTKDCQNVAMVHEEKQYYGVQFHPEVTHTVEGLLLLQDFALNVCKAGATWQGETLLETLIEDIQARVGEKDSVLLGLSGGVDSAVTAALLHQAIGDRLHCVFVDTGLLRQGEREEVIDIFSDHFSLNLHVMDARSSYLQALSGIKDPEEKRKIIGHLFIEYFEKAVASLPSCPAYLAQGTIYPDIIESSGLLGTAHVIKSHHNVGGLPEHLSFQLVEPLRALFKDEVRTLGINLGLPRDWVMRHPFPGPGLGVRIMGDIRLERIERLQKADKIFTDALRQSGWYDRVSQAFAVYLPVSSVGVVGDQRQYADVIALRSVDTDDFMTAKWSPLPHELLMQVATDIVNQVEGISRVVYDITGKPPATIEWE